jgi:hypothetical protein
VLDDDDDETLAICSECISDEFLSRHVYLLGADRECTYCQTEGKTYTPEEMADEIETVFRSHFQRTASEPDGFQYVMSKDPETDYEWEREGEPAAEIISWIAGISSKAAGEIQEVLAERYADYGNDSYADETEFDGDAQYEAIEPDDSEWHESWHDFEKLIKFESRFFSAKATAQLKDLFGDVGSMKTKKGEPLVVQAGPGTEFDHLYRARVFQSSAKLHEALKRPDLQLGPTHCGRPPTSTLWPRRSASTVSARSMPGT